MPSWALWRPSILRTYGLNAFNKYTDGFSKYQKSFITNDCSLVCVTPDCYANCEEFDLSEEYLIHIVHSTQPTNNPKVSHENICSFWSGDAIDMTSGEIASANGLCLPREKYAPYFGNANNNLNAYGTKHGHNDLGNIAIQSGIKTVTVDGWTWADSDFYKKNPTALTQEEVDDFEYDTRHIPLEARKNAVYRPTSVQQLSVSDARDVDEMEKYLANDHEVIIYVALGKLDMGDTVYYDNTPVDIHPDGNPIARYPITPPAFVGCTTAGCTGLWEGYDAAGNYYDAGHAMIIIAYDRPRRLFLLKNSWGNTRLCLGALPIHRRKGQRRADYIGRQRPRFRQFGRGHVDREMGCGSGRQHGKDGDPEDQAGGSTRFGGRTNRLLLRRRWRTPYGYRHPSAQC